VQCIWWPGNINWVTLLPIDQLVVNKVFLLRLFCSNIWRGLFDPLGSIKHFRTVSIFQIYHHIISRVVDCDDSFRLKLLGTARTSSAYPTHFNYKSFLQVLYCMNISHTCWATRSFFSTCCSPWPIIFLSAVLYVTFFYFSIIFLKFELRLSIWKVLRIAFCGENWHYYRNKATLNGAIKMTNNVL